MFILMVVVFVVGYICITLEHSLKVDKAVPALLIAVFIWIVYIMGADKIIPQELIAHTTGGVQDYLHHELIKYLGHASEILFFLMGAMTIVETIDTHRGFEIVTGRIKEIANSKTKLLWIVGFISFFFSAALDNLTTSIVMISLLRKLVSKKDDRWFLAGIVVISANAGGAWSPIGDVTTTMLWIGKQITAGQIIKMLILPSFVSVIVPLVLASFYFKGSIPIMSEEIKNADISESEKKLFFFAGVSVLLLVPVLKTLFHIPPYMGMMFGVSMMWIINSLVHKNKPSEVARKYSLTAILGKIEMSSVLFFLGILMGISALQSAGHLELMAVWLKEHINNVYGINLAIGLLSSIVDNVPLVAASMGMYPITTPDMLAGLTGEKLEWASAFIQNGKFWEFLAYCAGTGGSALIIGSAAGVAVMGLEKISFFWYLKRISLLAIIGYFSGAAVYILMF